MTDKDQCQHSSWKSVSGGKVACEICGAVGEERHYIKLDDPDLDLSDTFTRMFALAEHWMKRARAAEIIIGGRADYRNELPEPYAALAAAQEREAKLIEALERLIASCDESDGAQYGTLGTDFVRHIAQAALSQSSQAPAQGEPAKQEGWRERFEKLRDTSVSVPLPSIWVVIDILESADGGWRKDWQITKELRELAAAPKEHDHD